MRELFRITNLFAKSFTRKAVWMILLSIGVLSALGCYVYVYKFEPSLAMQETAYSQIMLTLVFMMMGIELRREQRREHFDDLIGANSKRAMFYPWGQVLTIAVIDLAVTLMIIAGCYVRMVIDGAPALWIDQTLNYVVLLYFFPCLILGIWGLLISQWIKSKAIYLPAMLVWILTSSLYTTYFADYLKEIGFISGNLYLNLLNMGMNNFHTPGNFVTGVPIELPRWIVRMGIMALLVTLFICYDARAFASTRSQKQRRWIGIASVLVCGIAMMTFFYLRYYVFFDRFADPDAVQKYVWNKDQEYDPGKPVSLADYPTDKRVTLSKTDIGLSCTTQGIKAEVSMEATTDTEASSQAFTLYSDLVVDEVRVDGKKAQFQRSHDGLMVYFPTAKNVGDKVAFVFSYHGYSLPNFPANETTVQLNRSFPWIPWPGIKAATSYSNFYNYSESEDFFIADWQRGDEVEYTLRYQGPGNVYTNLVAQGNNLYTGASNNGISLYSGMVHYRFRDVDVYIPASQSEGAHFAVDALLDAYDPLLELCERMGTIKKPKKPRSIVLIQMRYPMINTLVLRQEPYSWGEEWEICQGVDTSSTILERKYINSEEEYRNSVAVRAQMAVAYLLNPCIGYPIDVSHGSTRNYAAWLSVYLRANKWEDNDLKEYRDMLKDDYSGNRHDLVKGNIVPETPLTQEEKNCIDDILTRMHAGENFDAPFKALYNRLLHGEAIAPSDIVSALYNHQGG